MVFWDAVVEIKKPWITRIFDMLLGAQIAFTSVVLLLQSLNICHFPAVLRIEHVLLLLMVGYFIALSMYNIIKKQRFHRSYGLGIVIFIVFILGDGLQFYLQKYANTYTSTQYKSHLYVGTLIFVILLLVDYGYELIAILYFKARKEVLEKYAYTDVLTDLFNRRYCEEIFDELDKSRENYWILYCDLNNLKKVNDEFGHDVGDLIIRRFSEILKRIFGSCGIVGRMGGDEFIVIVKSAQNSRLKEKIQAMNQAIEMDNCNSEVKLSVAYGYFCSEEDKTLSVKEGYHIADQRMYQMKLKQKIKEN